MLAVRRGEKQLEGAELQQLQKEVYNLRNEIRNAEITPKLKLFLEYQLGIILDAIERYQLFGIKPLEHATQEAMGSFLLNPEALERIQDTPVVGKYRDLLARSSREIFVDVGANLITEVVKRVFLPPR